MRSAAQQFWLNVAQPGLAQVLDRRACMNFLSDDDIDSVAAPSPRATLPTKIPTKSRTRIPDKTMAQEEKNNNNATTAKSRTKKHLKMPHTDKMTTCSTASSPGKVLAHILKITGGTSPRTRVHKEGSATGIMDQPIKVRTITAGREHVFLERSEF